MKYLLSLSIALILVNTNSFAQKYQLHSPDGKLRVSIVINSRIAYEVSYKGKEIISPSDIAMVLKSKSLGIMPQVIGIERQKTNKVITCLNCKFAKLSDHYSQLRILFRGHYAIIFRAYNEGLAYRFITTLKDSLKVINETAQFNLTGDPEAILPESNNNLTEWEVPYITYDSISLAPKGDSSILPALFKYKKLGINVVLAEADLIDYPGMYIQSDGAKIHGFWACYPSHAALGSWGKYCSVVTQRAPYIAFTRGTRSFPWRVVIIADNDKTLLSNELIYKLATPSQIHNTSWIKPGKAAWEWWSDATLPGANIPSGMKNRNTALYKYYVDFAAKYHLKYILIDAGWSNVFHLTEINSKINIRQVIAYAKKKKVGVFLWCVATTLMDSLQGNMSYFRKLGVAGIKVDFFQRNDQQISDWYLDIAKAAAKNKLMVDFHGCSEPTGLQRTYPNMLNFEAVRGNECNKWDTTSNPDYHLLIPFIRMLAGPMDYTPGSMRNKSRATFKPVPNGMPYSQGTRCHELAIYVIFDQPLAMLCGSPTIYEKYPDIMKFLSVIPTVFDDTKILDAKTGQYVLMAKRKDRNWYIGAMTNWTPRELTLSFSFLPSRTTYKADVYTDTPSSDLDAERYEHKVISVNQQTKLDLRLASGGGAVVYLHF